MSMHGVAKSSPLSLSPARRGVRDKCYELDGVDERVDLDAAAAANTIDWDGSKSWSVSVWFKNPGTSYATLWSVCSTTAAANRYMEVASFYSGATGKIRFYGLASTTGGLTLTSPAPSPSGGSGRVDIADSHTNGILPNDGNWHNVILTVNSAADTVAGLNIYLDGLPAGYAKTAALTNTWDFLKVGCRVQTNNTSLTQFTPGLFSKLSIYSSALSAGQVANVWAGGHSTDERLLTPAPVNFYRFGNDAAVFPAAVDIGTGGDDGDGVNMEAIDVATDQP